MSFARSRLLVAALALLALLAVAFTPTLADGKSRKRGPRSVAVGVKLPQQGKIGLAHAVFKAGKARRAARAAKRGSKRPKVRFKVKAKKKIPNTALFYGRVSKLKKKRNTYAADLVVINRKPGARSSGARKAGGEELQPGGMIVIEIRIFTAEGQVVNLRLEGTVEEDDDIAGDDPDNDPACPPSTDTQAIDEGMEILYGGLRPLPTPDPDTVIDDAKKLCGDKPLMDSFFDIFFDLRPPTTPGMSCTGSLAFAPPPFNTSEFEVSESCTADKTGMGFLMPSGTQIQAGGFLPLQTFTSCDIQSRSGSTNNFLFCQGNQPAGTQGKVRIHPNPAPTPGMTINGFPFQGGTELGPFPLGPL